MMILISQNFHTWIKELKDIAKKIKIWKFIDSNDQKLQSESIDFFEIFNFQISIVFQSLTTIIAGENALLSFQIFVTRLTKNYNKLSNAQQKRYQINIIVYQIKKKLIKKMTHDMKIINNALKTSTRIYIFNANMNVSIRDINKTLIDKYQRSNIQINQ